MDRNTAGVLETGIEALGLYGVSKASPETANKIVEGYTWVTLGALAVFGTVMLVAVIKAPVAAPLPARQSRGRVVQRTGPWAKVEEQERSKNHVVYEGGQYLSQSYLAPGRR